VPPGGSWTARGGGLAVSLCVRQVVPSASDIWSLATVAHRGVHESIHLLLQVFYFFPITNRDCVALQYVDISTPTILIDKVVVACPPGYNNSDAHGQAIYVSPVTDPSGDTTHTCSSSSSKLMVRVSVVRHHLQVAMPPHMLQSG
jgi:hypothetical protein